MSNDFVAMETLCCPVCGSIHSHGAGILIDKHLRAIDPEKTTTGYGLCEEHETQINDGYVMLIEVTDSNNPNETRTGTIAGIKGHVFTDMFDAPVPEKSIAFVDRDVVAYLEQLNAGIEGTAE